MVSAALLVLLDLGRVDAFIALIIIGREITISALREWMAKIGASGSVAVHRLGKFKTAAQMVAIPCLLYWSPVMGLPTRIIGQADYCGPRGPDGLVCAGARRLRAEQASLLVQQRNA